MLVQAGDSVTVSLSQVNPDLWDISLQDNTSGQGFNVQEAQRVRQLGGLDH
ncbi:MAG TPA: hypothetical protein VEJ84_04265 [Acidimicrobiales bacterium]|nr:hypothetical protein [Acidimicrobiales bacterium]